MNKTKILGNKLLDTSKAQNPRWLQSLMENMGNVFSMSDGSHLGFWALHVSKNVLPKIHVQTPARHSFPIWAYQVFADISISEQ